MIIIFEILIGIIYRYAYIGRHIYRCTIISSPTTKNKLMWRDSLACRLDEKLIHGYDNIILYNFASSSV